MSEEKQSWKGEPWFQSVDEPERDTSPQTEAAGESERAARMLTDLEAITPGIRPAPLSIAMDDRERRLFFPEERRTRGTPPAKPARPDAPAAVIVVHGMGQQVPFETIDAVIEGLRRADARFGKTATRTPAGQPPSAADASPNRRRRPRGEKPPSRVKLMRVGTLDLPRADLCLDDGTESGKHVHCFEAYWAPLTEGKVTLRDVLGFLLRAARNGRRNAKRDGVFRRFMFGRVVPFTDLGPARRSLKWALAVLLSLVLLNAVTTGIFGTAVLHKSDVAWASPTLVAEVTAVVGVSIVLGFALFVLMMRTKAMALFFVLLSVVIAAAAGVTALLGLHAFVEGWRLWPENTLAWLASPWAAGLFWTLLFGTSLWVRELLVQYVGDVAAYVEPHHVDRFCELRREIKKAVREVAEAIYSHRNTDNSLYYGRIAIVGHSLGSVAAYDVLNALLNKDLLDPNPVNAGGRTCMLLTFGSPLDKTAFIFTAQGHSVGQTREALAAAVQPLISDYRFRRFPWVNVYSPADIISGKLDLYDLPDGGSPQGAFAVENVVDVEATTPVAAHTEYWKSDVVFEHLHRALTGPDRGGAPGQVSSMAATSSRAM
jgi:hypothetical protein